MALAAPFAACAADPPGCGREGADGRLEEWVIVLRGQGDAGVAQRWLQNKGFVVKKVLADLKLVHVLLPACADGERAVAQIREQPWAQLVTDQAVPRPGG